MKERKLLSSLLVGTIFVFLSFDPVLGFFPIFRRYSLPRRPARPQNPIYVSPDRVSKVILSSLIPEIFNSYIMYFQYMNLGVNVK